MALDIQAIRRQFPILNEQKGEKPLVYLDNAATVQKPVTVLERMQRFYMEENANVHRGMHSMTEGATAAYEHSRLIVSRFLNATSSDEIIFTRNATEAINMVARSFGETLKKGDTVMLTQMEHHSNSVPWLQLADRTGVKLVWIPVNAKGELDEKKMDDAFASGKIKLFAVTGLSNVLGVKTDLKNLIGKAHNAGAKVLVDAAQLVAHDTINVRDLDCDFLAFSGHKIYGPTGIGVLYGKRKLLEEMPPFLSGGGMIANVSEIGFESADIPHKFEAGTPAIAEAIGLGSAIKWMDEIGCDAMYAHTQFLIKTAHEKFSTIKGITIFGPQKNERRGCISFTIDGIHAHDLTEILGRKNICLRAGHHCTEPLHKALKVPATTRLSVAVYNTEAEIDTCVAAIEKAVHFFRG